MSTPIVDAALKERFCAPEVEAFVPEMEEAAE